MVFDVDVHMQTPFELLPKGFAIFFELMHYKKKKEKVSCRCFGFVERDEIKAGSNAIELYKKPVDYKRKKLILFTEKPLFLHLHYTLEHGNEY